MITVIQNWDKYTKESLKRLNDIFETLPKCKICGEPLLEGGVCSCVLEADRKRKLEEQARNAEIERLGGLFAYERYKFANYDNRKAVDACEGYPDCNLYIWGKAGTGKTHLATAVVRTFSDGLVIHPLALLRKLRALNKDAAKESVVIGELIKANHLLIDDIGVEKSTGYSMSVFYEIISERELNCKNGLIVTSNLSLNELAAKIGDDRITSRLAGMCRGIEITGEDRRAKSGR